MRIRSRSAARNPARARLGALAAVLAALLADAAVIAAADEVGAGAFIRVSGEPDASVALEIAARRYERADGAGPPVTLVGVVHIGDGAYYRDVQKLLADQSVVLYESVKPEGTGGAGGDTDGLRIASTRAALRFVAGLIEAHHARENAYPEDLAALRDFAAGRSIRLGQFLDDALVDAWGTPLDYTRLDPARLDPGGSDPGGPDTGAATLRPYRLLSYGADGVAGGEDMNADMVADAAADVDLDRARAEDNIQSQLAGALALEFQLDAIDYESANWVCSDMSMDQVQRAMAARGADFTLVEGALAGTSLPARIAKLLLGFVRFADAFASGAISDTLKILLIEMLGDESMIQASLEQVDPAFAQVIIQERNQVVVDDLRRLVERAPETPSVAILYGAGHMTDLAARLEDQLGYEPRDAAWLRAIEVDLTQSAVRPADVARLRRMMKQMMGGLQR